MITYEHSFIINTQKGLMGPDILEDNMPVREALESDIKTGDLSEEQELKNGSLELPTTPDILNDKLLSSGGTTPEIIDEGDEFDITLRFSGDEDEDIAEPVTAVKECKVENRSQETVKDNSTACQDSSAENRSFIDEALNNKSLNGISFSDDIKIDQLNTDDESFSGKYLINDLSLAIQPCSSSLGSKCGSKDKSDSACCCAKKYSSMEKSLSAVLDDIDEVLNDCDPNKCNISINKESTSKKLNNNSETDTCATKDDEIDCSKNNRDNFEEQTDTKKPRDSDKIHSDKGAKKNECFKFNRDGGNTDTSDDVPNKKNVVSKKSSDTCDKVSKNDLNSKITNDISDTVVNNPSKKNSCQNKTIESLSEIVEETKKVNEILEVDKKDSGNVRMSIDSSVSESDNREKDQDVSSENSNLNTTSNDLLNDSKEQSSQESQSIEKNKNASSKVKCRKESKRKLSFSYPKHTKHTPRVEDTKKQTSEFKRLNRELENEEDTENSSEKTNKRLKNCSNVEKNNQNDGEDKLKIVSEKTVDRQTADASSSSKHNKISNKISLKKSDAAKTSKKTETRRYSLKSSENAESSQTTKSVDYSELLSDISIDVDDKKLSEKTAKKTLSDKREADANQAISLESRTDEEKDEDKSSKKRQLDEKQSGSNVKRLKNDDSSKKEESNDNSSTINKKKLRSSDLKFKSALALKFLPLLIENGELNPEAIDIEEFVITKIIEVITQRSELSELRDKINKHEAVCDQYRQKIAHLTKQLSDMDVVVERLTQELKIQDRPVIPVKITRSVGLQVTLAVGPPRRPTTNLPSSSLLQKNDNTPNQRKKMTRTAVTPVPIRPMPNKNIVNGITKSTSNDNLNNSAVLSKSIQVTKTVNNNSPRSNVASKNNSVAEKPVIDLTDEDDNRKSIAAKIVSNSTNVNSTVSATTTGNMLIPISSGNTLVVAPQQLAVLTGTNGMQTTSRVSYIMAPTPVVNGPKQVLIGQPQTVQSGAVTKNILRPTASLLINRPPAFNQKSLSQLANYPTPIVPNNAILQNIVRPTRLSGARLSTPMNTNSRSVVVSTHPAPPPIVMDQLHMRGWKQIPPRPSLRIKESENGIQLSWSMPEMNTNVHEDIASYQIFAYQEQSGPPATDLWRKVGDVKALPLPMACTLTSFQGGFQYYFAVRALDIHSRFSQFSYAQPISLDRLKS